jgi:hypothetical protein
MDPGYARKFAPAIEDSTRRWAERLWTRWGKRCCGTNKYFKTFRRHRGWAITSRHLDRDVAKRVLADPLRPLEQPDVTLLKESRTTTVAEMTMSVRGLPTSVVYKRFKSKKPFEWALNILRPTRAWRAWQAAQHLVSRGIPTPQNLAIIERTAPLIPIPLETFLIAVRAEGARSLGDYITDDLPGLAPDVQRRTIRSLTKSLAFLLRTLHERSISDRDLKAANILIEGDPAAEDPRLSLIDLVGVQLRHPIPRHRRLQNLARLQVSLEAVPGRTRTDALRFLRSYLVWGLSPLNDWKGLWRDVERLCDRKRERNRNRGRLLS